MRGYLWRDRRPSDVRVVIKVSIKVMTLNTGKGAWRDSDASYRREC